MKVKSDDDASDIFEKLVIKAVCKAVKVAKAFVVLKWTKKVKSLREESAGDESDELRATISNLQDAKAIDHIDLGTFIAAERYPHIVKPSDSRPSTNFSMVMQITSSKQFNQAMEGLEEKMRSVVEKKSKMLRKSKESAKKKAKSAASKANAEEGGRNPALAGASSTVKPRKQKILPGKAMFMDSLDGGQVVVPASAAIDEEAWMERKKQKGLRNQRNRILNKLRKETTEDADLQKYLPVHLRNLTEPVAKGKKQNQASSAPGAVAHDGYAQTTGVSNALRSRSEELPSNARKEAWPKNESRPVRKRTIDPPVQDTRNDHKRMRTQPPAAPAPPAAAPVVSAAAVTTGKDWQKTGVHPSWAAKQMKAQQALKIDAAPAAKKIIFDD